jgi:hypothetical protein
VIKVYLKHFEYSHYYDLYTGGKATLERFNELEASPVERRERALMALSSVVGMDKPRERIGTDEVEVYETREERDRWA